MKGVSEEQLTAIVATTNHIKIIVEEYHDKEEG